MKNHLFIIDPLDELDIKKDSTLLFILRLKEQGHHVYVTFPKLFSYHGASSESFHVKAFGIEGKFKANSSYIEQFKLLEKQAIQIDNDIIIHQRMDPPFDLEYLNITWLLSSLEQRGIKIINSAKGILSFNEKLIAFEHPSSLPTVILKDVDQFEDLINTSFKSYKDLVLKPLDLYQGIGVEKISTTDSSALRESFVNKLAHGPVVIQPFYSDISKGEVRTFYFGGKHMASILKVPKEGDFLANIARGASFEEVELNDTQKNICEEISAKLMKHKVPWIAFDLLGNHVNEVNITCPGLLVELCEASNKNLPLEMAKELSSWAR